jgi:hypothetical protein
MSTLRETELTPADGRLISYLKALYEDSNHMCVQYVKTGVAYSHLTGSLAAVARNEIDCSVQTIASERLLPAE